MEKEIFVYRIYEVCNEDEKSFNYGYFDSEVNRKLIDSGYIYCENTISHERVVVGIEK